MSVTSPFKVQDEKTRYDLLHTSFSIFAVWTATPDARLLGLRPGPVAHHVNGPVVRFPSLVLEGTRAPIEHVAVGCPMMERTGSRSMRSVSSSQERHTEVEPWPSRSLAATRRGGDASFLRTLALLRAGAADAPAAARPPAAVSISAERRR